MAILPTGWNDTTQHSDPPEQQALDAILSADLGAELDRVELDGRIHRFKVRGDKSREKSGWYKSYGDRMPAGAFGNSCSPTPTVRRSRRRRHGSSTSGSRRQSVSTQLQRNRRK